MKRGGMGIPYPCLLVELAHNTSNASRKLLVGSLLGRTDLNYVAHKARTHRSSVGVRKQQGYSDIKALTRRKEDTDGAGLNFLPWETKNGVLLTAIP